MKLIAVALAMSLTGCAAQSALVQNDLDAAIAIADQYPSRAAAAACYRAHKAHAQMKVAGILSANEFGKTMPSFLDCAR